jgi:hypothetical protein
VEVGTDRSLKAGNCVLKPAEKKIGEDQNLR